MAEPATPPTDPAAARFARVAALFGRARRLPSAERGPFLAEACGDDPSLRAEVERLLGRHETRNAPLDETAGAAFRGVLDRAFDGGPAADEPLPERIGRYRILRRIGAGGMGTVYEAEEDAPRRRVALKVIRPEMASPEVRRRFEFEGQVLARLEHPGIARVYAVGTSETPRGPEPFLAMELVAGRPIVEHAAERRLDVAARIEVLARVCDAVAHAHRHGIVHRDLKPSNVLVDDEGQPKVLDFGVARAMGEGEETSLHTNAGHVLGTLAYMSPEQAAGDAAHVDARCDVYSLGVVAYEVLSGRLPHDVRDRPLAAALDAVIRQDPPTLGSLVPALRGDVSILVAKAIAKEKERRYDSAAAFADDLRRFLRDEPILARPPTASYQLRRFVRRHKALVAGVVGTVVALLAGLVISLVFARREAGERRRADLVSAAARRAAYRAELAAAAAALHAGDLSTVAARLASAPEELRGWEWRHLAARIDAALEHVPIPGGLGFSVLDAVGGRVVTVPPGGAVRAFDLRGMPLPSVPVVEPREVTQIVPSPDGRLWVGTRDGRVLAWEGPSLTPAPPLVRVDGAVEGLSVAPDGRRLAIGWFHRGGSPTLRIVDAATGATIAERSGEDCGPICLAHDAKGDVLLVAGYVFVAHALDARTLAPRFDLRGHQNLVRAGAFDAAGRRLVTAAEDRTAILWDAADGRPLHRLGGHGGPVTDVAWSPDGALVATSATDGTVRLWVAETGEPAAVLSAGPPSGVVLLSFDPSGERLLGRGPDGLTTWLPRRAEALDVLRGHRGQAEGNLYPYVYTVSYAPDGARLCSAGWDGTVRVWDAATAEPLATLECGAMVHAAAWSPRGDAIVAACRDGTVRRFDAATGRPLRSRAGFTESMAGVVCFDPPGGRVLVSGPDAGLRLIDATSLDDVGAWTGHAAKVRSAAFAPDGRLAATGDEGGACFLRDAADGRVVRTLLANGATVTSLAFDPAASRVAAGSDDRLVRIFDVRTGALLRTLEGHTSKVYAVAWLEGGARLASGGDDGTIRLWEPDEGRELAELRGHRAYVYGLSLSPDGATLASASGDNTVRLWSTRPFRERWREAEAARARRGERPPPR